ncbi:hypothetical protein IL306_010228 [Fusarium sp. DS 682]|nr:hypothetical protein IL306_010228 [Fusarium sp. DS 682]
MRNKRDIFGWTPLHYAATCQNFNFTEDSQHGGTHGSGALHYLAGFLTESQPEIWWLDKFNRSPVHIAALAGNRSFLDFLLKNLSDKGASLQAKGLDGMTPVHLAIQGDHLSCIEVIMETGLLKDLEIPTDAWKRTPIHLAIAKRAYSCGKRLLEEDELKFKPNTLDSFGKSLLLYLDETDGDQREIGNLLFMKHSGKFLKKDQEGNTVWHHAVRFLDEDSLHILKEQHGTTINDSNNDSQTPLHLAIKYRDMFITNRLMKLGGNPGINAAKDQSPLMFACSCGRLDIVDSMLRENKLIANDKDKHGKTALHYAILSEICDDPNRDEIIKSLVKVMKSVDVEDQKGCTPLHLASQNRKASVVSSLLASGASPRVQDSQGNNPLHYAVQSWYDTTETSTTSGEEIAESLIKKAPNCKIDQNEDGYTPLFLAVRTDKTKAALLLLMNGADPQSKSENQHHTPLTWASLAGGPLEFISKVVELANQPDSKIDINQGDSRYDEPPLAWACEYNNTVIVKSLLMVKSLDINKQAIAYNGYTALHIALEEQDIDIVRLLLDDTRITLGLTIIINNGFSLLEYALENADEDCLRELLFHHHTKSAMLSLSGWERIVQKYASMINELKIWDEWDDAITDEANSVQFPVHKLAAAGRIEKIESLRDSGSILNGLDEDNWTPADVARRYHHKELERILLEVNPNKRDLSITPYREPSDFINLSEESKLTSPPCSNDEGCPHLILSRVYLEDGIPFTDFVNYLDVKFDDRDNVLQQFCYLRAKEAIPPNKEFFYYEMEILRPLRSK